MFEFFVETFCENDERAIVKLALVNDSIEIANIVKRIPTEVSDDFDLRYADIKAFKSFGENYVALTDTYLILYDKNFNISKRKKVRTAGNFRICGEYILAGIDSKLICFDKSFKIKTEVDLVQITDKIVKCNVNSIYSEERADGVRNLYLLTKGEGISDDGYERSFLFKGSMSIRDDEVELKFVNASYCVVDSVEKLAYQMINRRTNEWYVIANKEQDAQCLYVFDSENTAFRGAFYKSFELKNKYDCSLNNGQKQWLIDIYSTQDEDVCLSCSNKKLTLSSLEYEGYTPKGKASIQIDEVEALEKVNAKIIKLDASNEYGVCSVNDKGIKIMVLRLEANGFELLNSYNYKAEGIIKLL